jgi:proteic killer suppression protein
MLDVRRLKSNALRQFARGNRHKISPQWQPRVRRILFALNAASHPVELNMPGFYFHELKGDRKGTYAVRVTGNWRITFRWDVDGPLAVDLEDYHGK